jgi:hypothetical protein
MNKGLRLPPRGIFIEGEFLEMVKVVNKEMKRIEK